MGRTKSFGGKEFEIFTGSPHKQFSVNAAKELRKVGYNARVVSTKNRWGDTLHEVYRRPRR